MYNNLVYNWQQMRQYCSAEPKQKNRYRKYPQSAAKSVNKAKPLDTVVFMAADEEFMGMYLPYCLSNDQTKCFIKQNGGFWCHSHKIWKIPKSSYTAVRTEIPRMLIDTPIEDLPLFIDRALKPVTEKLYIQETGKNLLYDPLDRHFKPEDNPIFHKLYDFQKVALAHAIRNYGRLLIADEMGVGKTLQSLACALTYEKQWPLLIICPSALKHVWKDQIQKWAKDIKENEIVIVGNNKSKFDARDHKIVIFSYEIATKSIEMLSGFNVVIADEAHYLKSSSAKRSQVLIPFLRDRKRVFLVTGTPTLSRPREIFNLIQVIRPDIFNSIKEFGDRYCFLTRNRWDSKLEYEGCRNTAQLYYLLKNRIMIRRRKDEVLHELPNKQRQIVTMETTKVHIKQMKDLMNSNQIPLEVLRNSEKLIEQGEKESNMSPLPRCYYLTGLAKLQSIKEYLSAMMENDVKILIFAHHKDVIEEICNHLDTIKVQHIRIDGSTTNETRRKNVKKFQDDFTVRAAVLSITAAGVGITLTASSTVIFAELHWTPAILLQAEDRAHRIGQRSCVNVHYLIGENSLDHLLMRELEKKLERTGEILNGDRQVLQAENISKGEMGKWEPEHPSDNRKKVLQPSLLSYIRKTEVRDSENEGQMQDQESEDIDEDYIAEDDIQRMIHVKEKELKQKADEKTRLQQQKDEQKQKQKLRNCSNWSYRMI